MKKSVLMAALAAFTATLISLSQAQAGPDPAKRIQPTTVHIQQAAVDRSPEQMAAFDATFIRPSGEQESPLPRPTMNPSLYDQLKRAAQLTPRSAKPGAGANLSPLPPVSIVKFSGASECDGPGGCWVPPDVAGAIGKANFVSASNDVIEIRTRAGVLQSTNSLNAFMGYSTKSLFDPRVQYDELYQRWIVTADAFQESTTVQYFFFAVSQTSNPTGHWWIYKINVTPFGGTGSLYDYPMLGQTQDALLFSANIFGASSFEGSSLFSVAKARVYNGQGFSIPIFTGLKATLQPAHQLFTDQNGYAWLAAAIGSGVDMYALAFPANPTDTSLHGPYTVSGIGAYSVAPGATQPASCAPSTALLDSLDGRFQNAGVQAGDTYYQTHTVALGGYPAPRYYVITGLLSFAPAVSVQNTYYASGSSDDFNPSIAADGNGHFAMNWSSTDPAAGIKASMYYTDNKTSNPAGSTGINVFQSAGCYTGSGTSRWGDYSSTTLDPGSGTRSVTTTNIYWIDNEDILNASAWSTEIAKVPF
jgi:hypothetical protein